MPDLPPAVSTLFAAARFALIAYATVATILTTACLTLQALTVFDRRLTLRAPVTPATRRARKRSLFVRLETEAEEG